MADRVTQTIHGTGESNGRGQDRAGHRHHRSQGQAGAACRALSRLNEQIGSAVDIKRLTFNPGDTIVVRVDKHMTRDMMLSVGDHVRKVLGIADLKVLVLDAGITIDVLAAA